LSRGERWTGVVIALAVGGCMRIYPDPELPDIVVEWFADFDCSADGERVVASLSTGDPAGEVDRATVPCRDGSLRFTDVARVQYHLSAHVESTSGAVRGGYDTDIDLRDGLNERVSVFFGGTRIDNFRVAWAFDMGASCETLFVTSMMVRASTSSGELVSLWGASCKAPVFMNAIPSPGMFTLSARAYAGNAVVASSLESPPFAVTPDMITDFGTLTLSPCGAACPPPGL